MKYLTLANINNIKNVDFGALDYIVAACILLFILFIVMKIAAIVSGWNRSLQNIPVRVLMGSM